MVKKKMEQWLEKASWLKEIGIFRLGVIVLAGVVLVICSAPAEKEQKENYNVSETMERKIETEELELYIENQEKRLTDALSMVEGIGDVKVMITAKSAGETVVLKDSPYQRSDNRETDSQGGTREQNTYENEENTVLQKMEDGSEAPYVTKELQPEIEGVVVIAQGGGNGKVVAEINEAVVALFSIPSHKIKVMKMK